MPSERAIRPNPLTDVDSSATPGGLRIRNTLRPRLQTEQLVGVRSAFCGVAPGKRPSVENVQLDRIATMRFGTSK